MSDERPGIGALYAHLGRMDEARVALVMRLAKEVLLLPARGVELLLESEEIDLFDLISAMERKRRS